MKFDLAALVRNVGTYRRPTFTAAAIKPTNAQRDDLQRAYMPLVRGWQQRFRERILPAYERALSELITDDAEEIASLLGVSEVEMVALAQASGVTVETFIDEVERWHRGQFAQRFTPTGVRISTLLSRGDVRLSLRAVLAENVGLIRSLNDQMRNGISGSVFRGLQNRTPARDVAREIQKLAGVGRRRAELIASDQLAKLTSQLDQQRQIQSGMTKFKWQHSGKVNFRQEHLDRNGKVYTWGEGIAESDPPGRKIRCGCRALGILDLDDED